MPKSTHSRIARAARRDPIADREAFLRALRSGEDTQIEAAWPGATVTKSMLADKVIAMHGEGEYAITDRGLAELAGPGHGNTSLIEPDADGLEPEQIGQYGEDDVAGSELAEVIVNTQPIGKVVDEDATQEQLNAEYDALVVEIRAEIGSTCACGCGAEVTPQRRFRQGHDQRLIGLLAEAAADGKEIGHLRGGVLVTGSPRSYGAKVLADGGCHKLDSAIKRAQEQQVVRLARTVAKKARATAKPAQIPSTEANRAPILKSVRTGPMLGDEVKVRIGRHEYYARVHGMSQAGRVTAVEYTVKSSGAKKVALEGKFEITSD